jgi:hypothetical protein
MESAEKSITPDARPSGQTPPSERSVERDVLGAELTVVPISATEWRVSDPSRKSDYSPCLIGFIEHSGEEFQTTRIGFPRERDRFPSLSAAVAFLAEHRSS